MIHLISISGRWRSPGKTLAVLPFGIVYSVPADTMTAGGSKFVQEIAAYEKQIPSFPSPSCAHFQQQRIVQKPNPISPTARANHQNEDGNTRDNMMISPDRTAISPQRQRRPLRIKNASRCDTQQSIRGRAFLYSSLYSQNLCWALSS